MDALKQLFKRPTFGRDWWVLLPKNPNKSVELRSGVDFRAPEHPDQLTHDQRIELKLKRAPATEFNLIGAKEDNPEERQ